MNQHPFMLPIGLSTSDGQIYRGGTMRLATALDEIEPVGDERVKHNEAYYGVLVLARVITQLGPFQPVTPEVIAALPAADYAYLQSLYSSLNNQALGAQMAAPQMMQAQNQGHTSQGHSPQDAQQGPRHLPQAIETECSHCGAVLELDLSELS